MIQREGPQHGAGLRHDRGRPAGPQAVADRQVAEAGIKHRVQFTGYSPQPRNFQSAMHVCVFPSEGEPFGIAALETLSLGKPTVVMKDGGGLLEIIAPLEPQDVADNVEMLAARLEHYYAIRDVDTRQRDRMEHAKKFDIAVMEQAFYQVYSELLR